MFTPVRLALAWMTVLPTGVHGVPDTRDSGRAMTALPVVGAVCGLLVVAVGWGFRALGAPPLLAAALGLTALVGFTRGMHVDALADTVDGLGSYADPQRAREIMRSGSVGPMGATALVLVLLVDAAALAQLIADGAWIAVICALVLSRCLPIPMLRRGVPAASSSGFGAQVAGSQSAPAVAAGAVVAALAGAGWTIGPDGAAGSVPLATGAVLALLTYLTAAASTRHLVRRLGGISGDALGAAIEIGTAAALVGATMVV